VSFYLASLRGKDPITRCRTNSLPRISSESTHSPQETRGIRSTAVANIVKISRCSHVFGLRTSYKQHFIAFRAGLQHPMEEALMSPNLPIGSGHVPLRMFLPVSGNCLERSAHRRLCLLEMLFPEPLMPLPALADPSMASASPNLLATLREFVCCTEMLYIRVITDDFLFSTFLSY
jgi:hypothetical protein